MPRMLRTDARVAQVHNSQLESSHLRKARPRAAEGRIVGNLPQADREDRSRCGGRASVPAGLHLCVPQLQKTREVLQLILQLRQLRRRRAAVAAPASLRSGPGVAPGRAASARCLQLGREARGAPICSREQPREQRGFGLVSGRFAVRRRARERLRQLLNLQLPQMQPPLDRLPRSTRSARRAARAQITKP